MTTRLNQLGKFATTCSLAFAALLFASSIQTVNAQGCATGLGSSIQLDKTLAHIGETVTVTLTRATTASGDCNVTNVVGWIVFPNNTAALSMTNVSLTSPQTFTCTGPSGGSCVSGVNYTYVIQAADMGRDLSFDTPLRNSCVRAGSTNTVRFLFAAEGTALTSPVTSTAFACNNAPVTIITPGIACQKFCANGIGENGQITFSGFVTNTGDTALFNVAVSNLVNGALVLVTNISELGIGQSVNYSGSYTPPNPCVPTQDTILVRGTDVLGLTVTSQCSATCSNILTPGIIVTKNCPPTPTHPGTPLVYSGIVSNSGNVTLTNVVVVNDQPAPNTVVLGPITLAPSASVAFTNSYIVRPDSCGAYPDTVTARATTICGLNLTNTATAICPGTNAPGIDVTKVCPPGLIQPGGVMLVSGTVTNTGNITLTNVVVTNSISALGVSRRVFGPVDLAPGAGAVFTDNYIVPLDSCGPYADTFAAFGADKCFGRVVTDSATAVCPGTNSPSIDVTKNCPPGVIQPGGTVLVTGNIVNTGNITLTNVVVTNHIAALGISRRVFGPVNLAPGVGANFSDTYVVPLDSCGPYADTFAASGADKCFGRIVIDSATVACPSTNSPGIAVFKNCPPNPVPPGGLMIVTGFVTNTGNITLTNVSVTNIIAATGQTRRIFGPVNLPPGGSATFSDSYVVPPNTCGPYRDTFLASGADKCFGRILTASDFKDCPGITTPRIAVTKQCPVNPVAPGGIAVFSGTVSNAGNITLTNVVVVNNRPTNNTPVIGPITLAPGQSTNFTGSYAIPANCCSYFDTLTASGNSFCTGSNVTASATAVCPTVTDPRLVVTKNCPPNPVPLGQPLVFSGIVSNAGNITLVGVIVVDNLPTNNTPVFGPITLAPGESAQYIGNHIVPINICSPTISDTVTARGTNICTGSNVIATATAVCPIILTPRLSLTKVCPPNPVAPGQLLVYSGIVSNSGNITITNVFVVNDRPAPETPVIGPITLVPGQATNFTGSYLAPFDCCGPCVDTLTARGKEFCNGSNVVATASAACPRITSPGIKVTRDCPPGPPTVGELVFVTGVVSNSGNATLVNVRLADDQAGIIMDNAALAPGEAVWYLGMFITTNCGPSIPAGITATANDACFSTSVSNRFVTTCGVLCPSNLPIVLLNPHRVDSNILFSFQTELNANYKIQFSPTLGPENWQEITTLPGTGSLITVSHSATGVQGFYRVVKQ